MNKLKNIKLIASDFDQTLFMPELKFPKNTREYIHTLHELGIKFVIVSGRDPYEMRSLLEDKGVKWAEPFPDFLVCIEKYIYDPQGNDLNKQAKQWNEQAKKHTQTIDSEMVKATLAILDFVKKHKIPIAHHSGTEIAFPSPEIAEKARALVRKFADEKFKQENFIISGNLYSINLSPSWPTKGDTLKFLAENILGLKPYQVLAIGDHINDISMLDGSRGFMSATVVNAHPQVKSAVINNNGIIAREIGPEGVGKILKKIHSAYREALAFTK